MFWNKKNKKEIAEMQDRILDMDVKINTLLIAGKELDNIQKLTKDEKERLTDLEVKMAKLWGILLETTPAGKDKLSKFGRRFGGQSKGRL